MKTFKPIDFTIETVILNINWMKMKTFKPIEFTTSVGIRRLDDFADVMENIINLETPDMEIKLCAVGNLMEYRPMLHILDLIEESLGCLDYYKVL